MQNLKSPIPGKTMSELEQLALRRHCFEHELGFTETQAFDLAIAGVKLIPAQRLLKDGCSHALAVKILL